MTANKPLKFPHYVKTLYIKTTNRISTTEIVQNYQLIQKIVSLWKTSVILFWYSYPALKSISITHFQ